MAKETMESLRKELEVSQQAHNETLQEAYQHRIQLNKIGGLLDKVFNPLGLNTITSRARDEFSVADIMAMSAQVRERITGLEHHLAREKDLTRDLLDRYAPLKEKEVSDA